MASSLVKITSRPPQLCIHCLNSPPPSSNCPFRNTTHESQGHHALQLAGLTFSSTLPPSSTEVMPYPALGLSGLRLHLSCT